MTIYARKGEHVTCENGHHICTVAHDLIVGATPKTGGVDFIDWTQPEPVAGTMAKDCACAVCGALWLGGPDGNIATVLHFEDGWRYWDSVGKPHA